MSTENKSTENRLSPELVRQMRRAHKLDDEAYAKFWLERVMLRTTITEGGCWLWQGSKSTEGYGQTTYRSKAVQIHRRMYLISRNVTLTSKQLVCHSCDVRLCHNPEHLWIGSKADNSLDMVLKRRMPEQSRTHCPKGHEYNAENTNYKKAKSGRLARECRECQRAKAREYWRSGNGKARQLARREAKRLAETGLAT